MLTQAIDQVSDSQASKLLINNWHLPSLVTEQRNTLCANLFPSNLVLQCQDKPNFPLGENSQLLQGQDCHRSTQNTGTCAQPCRTHPLLVGATLVPLTVVLLW